MLKREDISQIKGFYQLPKFLFKTDKYKKMSVEAKTLYALIIDRVKLSCKNNWLDEEENIYIIFTNEEVRRELNCCLTTAIKIMKELKSYGLISAKRQGLGKPNLIYPQKIAEILDLGNSKIKNNVVNNSDINNSVIKNSVVNDSIINNNQEIIKNNNSSNNEHKVTAEQEIKYYEKILKENIDYEKVVEYKIVEKDRLDEILEIMLEIVTNKKDTIKISKGNEVSTAIFKSRILKMGLSEIEYILNCIDKTTHKIINMKNYLLSTLYNAKTTMDSYYSNWVRSDMYGYGGI